MQTPTKYSEIRHMNNKENNKQSQQTRNNNWRNGKRNITLGSSSSSSSKISSIANVKQEYDLRMLIKEPYVPPSLMEVMKSSEPKHWVNILSLNFHGIGNVISTHIVYGLGILNDVRDNLHSTRHFENDHRFDEMVIYRANSLMLNYLRVTPQCRTDIFDALMCVCLALSSKCLGEDTTISNIATVFRYCNDDYTQEYLLDLERDVANRLHFDLSIYTRYDFMCELCNKMCISDSEYDTASYLLLVTAVIPFFYSFRESQIATVVVAIALGIHRGGWPWSNQTWVDPLEYYSGYVLNDLNCIFSRLFHYILSEPPTLPTKTITLYASVSKFISQGIASIVYPETWMNGTFVSKE